MKSNVYKCGSCTAPLTFGETGMNVEDVQCSYCGAINQVVHDPTKVGSEPVQLAAGVFQAVLVEGDGNTVTQVTQTTILDGVAGSILPAPSKSQ